MTNAIACIVSSEYLKFQIEQLLKIHKQQMPIYCLPVELDATLFKAEQLLSGGAHVIVARGRHVEMLRKHLDVPVVEIHYTFDEFVTAVTEAMEYTRRIALVGYNSNFIVPKLRDLFDFDQLEFRLIENPLHTRETLKELQAQGIECIISGQNIGRIAEEVGLHSVLTRIGENSFLNAMRDASYYRRLEAEKQRQFESIATLLDHAQEGILSIDTEGTLRASNSFADQMLNLSGSLGKESIYRFLPKELIGRILDGIPVYNEIVSIGSDTVLLNGIATQPVNAVRGAVITLQAASDVHQKESTLRKQMRAKGRIAKNTFAHIIGSSSALSEAKTQAATFAATNANILIYGETGTGKELFAQSIHNASSRHDRPFVAVNCAALPESILESELFGYVKGAFTGANPEGKAGIFEQAHTGTIFLDEISEISPSIQARLLRVIQEREITRIGDDRTIPVDVRIITSTNRNLLKDIREHKFREDLFYRINVLSLRLPPLSERKEDIADLAVYYTERFSKQAGRRIQAEPDALQAMTSLSWPGNVRQLRNFVEAMVALCQGDSITASLVNTVARISLFDMNPAEGPVTGQTPASETASADAPVSTPSAPLVRARRPLEDETAHILEVLRQCGGNKTKAAEMLGIGYATLWRKLKRIGSREPADLR